VPAGACFALVTVGGPIEAVVMLLDDEGEANEIAAGVRQAGQQIVVRRYLPPQRGRS
jgi:hypothetical protein